MLVSLSHCILSCLRAGINKAQVTKVFRMNRGMALLFLGSRHLMGMEGSAPRPGRFYPRERPGTHFTRRMGGPQGRSGRAENLVPTGIRSRTVEPVVNRLIRCTVNNLKITRRSHNSTAIFKSVSEILQCN